MCDLPGISIYLQVVSIFMAVVAVAIPALIAIVGFVYIRSFNDRIDNIADEVDQLWWKFEEIEDKSAT